ncbi:hypothetical protein DES53_11397 [Roseimicrobium gellanilyticum]|uniref:Uncharacterized protein n=1 Tax=Roseimicrobium gellanilyticum TaxID=748857 RepID=A0A366H9F1_9BACT|nr:hypothetical protein DES53_11397 [Roseimicrobium gellanilyticum]
MFGRVGAVDEEGRPGEDGDAEEDWLPREGMSWERDGVDVDWAERVAPMPARSAHASARSVGSEREEADVMRVWERGGGGGVCDC